MSTALSSPTRLPSLTSLAFPLSTDGFLTHRSAKPPLIPPVLDASQIVCCKSNSIIANLLATPLPILSFPQSTPPPPFPPLMMLPSTVMGSWCNHNFSSDPFPCLSPAALLLFLERHLCLIKILTGESCWHFRTRSSRGQWGGGRTTSWSAGSSPSLDRTPMLRRSSFSPGPALLLRLRRRWRRRRRESRTRTPRTIVK